MSEDLLGASVRLITTHLTGEVEVQAVQLVQPVGYRFAVPTQWQVLRVVWYIIIVVIALLGGGVLVV